MVLSVVEHPGGSHVFGNVTRGPGERSGGADGQSDNCGRSVPARSILQTDTRAAGAHLGETAAPPSPLFTPPLHPSHPNHPSSTTRT